MSQVEPPSYVEVEIGTFCNRRCPWCPNGWHDRGARQQHMEPAVWLRLLLGLRQIGYGGELALHNFNEPLADPTLFDKLAQARAIVPGARLVIASNGDRLDRALLENLIDAGVAELRVTRYPDAAAALEAPDPERLRAWVGGLGLADEGQGQRRERREVRVVQHRGATLLVGAPRVETYTDRAGSVRLPRLQQRAPRTWPCLYPFASAAVDVHGRLKLCCQIYDTTAPEAAPYVVGQVGETPFGQLWASERLQRLRAQLARADFTGLPACRGCGHRMTRRMATRIVEDYPVRALRGGA